MSMTARGADVEAVIAPGRVRWVSPAHWVLWSRPRRAIGFVLLVIGLAVASSVMSLVLMPVTRRQLVFAVVLLVGWLVYGELSRGIERIRRLHAGVPHIDLGSVWMVAAALLTHPACTAAVVVGVYAHPWLRIRHHPVHRRTFSGAAAVLALHAATYFVLGVLGPFADAPRTVATFAVVALAGVLFFVLNTALISSAIALTARNPTVSTVFAHREDYALEVATIALGILAAWALADWPVALLLVGGVALALHRNVLIRQLRDSARLDPKTGLLNAVTWKTSARADLARAERVGGPVGLLMLDLDHFKQINDGHGHIAADEILRTVAVAIKAEVREHDPVGRFGGDEFVVLLPGSGPAATEEVAERLRTRIQGLALPGSDRAGSAGLSVSIGAATYPDAATSLDELLQTADNALLGAKDHGRNQVRRVGVVRTFTS